MLSIDRKKPSAVLWYINIGFILIITLSWLDELAALPHALWGGPEPHGNWRESLMETMLAAPVWCVVYFYTRRIINRVHHLEGLLTVCAWCRKIRYNDQWIPLEEFFAEGFQTDTSHGMCPECAKNFAAKPSKSHPPS